MLVWFVINATTSHLLLIFSNIVELSNELDTYFRYYRDKGRQIQNINKQLIRSVFIMFPKALLAFVYYVANGFGIAPFKLCLKKTNFVAELTNFSTGYTVIVLITYNVLYVWSAMKFLIFDPDNYVPLNNMMGFVLKLDIYSCITRNLSIYLSLIYHRELLVHTINTVGRITTKLGLTFKTFLDLRCRTMVYVKLCVTSVQMAICIYITYYICQFPENSKSKINILKVCIQSVVNYVLSIIVSTVHFTTLLMVMQLFRIINNKLKKCVTMVQHISRINRRCMRMQIYCEISEQIDELSFLYKLVCGCNKGFCQVLSLSILTTILNSFEFMTAGVNNLSKHIYKFE